jgi:hypothetical protein
VFEVAMPESATIESWRGVTAKIMLLVRKGGKGKEKSGGGGGRRHRGAATALSGLFIFASYASITGAQH